MKLKILLLISLAVWWIPVVSGFILGYVSSVIERNYKKALTSLLISSTVSSVLYTSLSLFVKIPALGNSIFIIAVIVSVTDTIIAYLFFNFLFYRVAFSTITPDGIVSEFYVSSKEEIEERLGDILAPCSEPVLSLSENKISVHRDCSSYVVDYEMVEANKNKYKVTLHVKKKEF